MGGTTLGCVPVKDVLSRGRFCFRYKEVGKMPIKIQHDLPAREILNQENIFVMDETRAIHQDIRPIKIAILNLMPLKEATELQLLRALSNTPLQVDVSFVSLETHESTHTALSHLNRFYEPFSEISDKNFDGMIITGAPVEQLEFEEVDYFDELCKIMEWSKTHVTSTFHICWGAQAGLYYHFGIPKIHLPQKYFGVYPHKVNYKKSILFRGFDETFMVPQSRHTTVLTEDIKKVKELKILASSPETGVYAISTNKGKQIFITGHSEYERDTLKNEYLRDKEKGLDIAVPKNYFPNDDPSKEPIVSWRAHANLLFSNWLNYFVYQTTPYDIDMIE